MLTQYENEYGVISLDEGLVYQLISDSLKPWEGKARIAGDREVRLSENGIYIFVPLGLKFGSSISEISRSVIAYIADAVANSLELPIDDIVVKIAQISTSKTTVKKGIKISYSGREDEEGQQSDQPV